MNSDNWFPEGYGQEHADEICDRIAAGESLRAICETQGMMNERSVYRMLARNEAFSREYTRARKTWADAQMEEIIAVSRDPELKSDEKRVQIDTLKWAMGKLNGKYSDKTLLGSDPENPLPAPPMLDVSKLSTAALREVVEAMNAAKQ